MRLAMELALLLASVPPLAAQEEPAWRYRSAAEVERFALAATGAVLVRTDSGLVALDGADGHELWRRPGAVAFRGLGLTDVALLQLADHPEVVDLASGATRWSVRNTPLTGLYGYQSLPPQNLVLLYGPSAESPLSLLAVTLDSGTVRWRQDTLFAAVRDLPKRAGKIDLTTVQPPLQDSDSTIVLYPTAGGVMRLHLASGALLWRADTLAREEPRFAAAGYARLAADSAAVYVPYGRRLMALDRETGRVLWDRREEFPSFPAEVVPTARGILVRGYHRKKQPSDQVRGSLELLDPLTGASRWPSPLRDIHDAAAMLVAGDTVYLAAKKSLMVLDLSGAQLGEVHPLSWHGGEVPWLIERRGGALLIGSSQNLVCLTPGGEPRYERYYAAPGTSFLAKIASTTLILALDVASAATAQSLANSTHSVVRYPVLVSNPVLGKRYKATVAAERYVHMLTGAADETGRKGFSVVRLDKDSGRESGRVWVDDRSPDYVLDPAAGTVYLLRDKHSLEALRF